MTLAAEAQERACLFLSTLELTRTALTTMAGTYTKRATASTLFVL